MSEFDLTGYPLRVGIKRESFMTTKGRRLCYAMVFYRGDHPVARLYYHSEVEEIVMDTHKERSLTKYTAMVVYKYFGVQQIRHFRRLVSSKCRLMNKKLYVKDRIHLWNI